MDNAYAKKINEVLNHFSVSETQGLTIAQVEQARVKYGRNGKLSYPCIVPGTDSNFQ